MPNESKTLAYSASEIDAAIASVATKASKTELGSAINTCQIDGAKNMLPCTASSKTSNNIIFTVNADKTITAEIPASHGTGSTQLAVIVDAAVPERMRNRNLILSGAPVGGGDTTYKLILQDRTTGYKTVASSENGDSEVFTLPGTITTYKVIITIYETCPAMTVTFKPMIRDAGIADNTYQQYAPSNTELYNMILAL